MLTMFTMITTKNRNILTFYVNKFIAFVVGSISAMVLFITNKIAG